MNRLRGRSSHRSPLPKDRIEKRVELKAPAAKVWRALTDYREFGQWFGVKLETPFRVGEVVRGKVTHRGYEHMDWEATVRTMEERKVFAFSWHPYAVDPERDYSDERQTDVEFRLEGTRGGTLLVLTESGFGSLPADRREAAFLMDSGGWTVQLRNIENYLGLREGAASARLEGAASAVDIIDLSEEYEGTYCKCLEDWSSEMAEAGDYKARWLERKKKEGLRVKLARTGEGRIVGMIQYAPIEAAPVIGRDLYYVYCVWVHGYKEGVGNNQKRGIGTALLAAAEADAESLGGKGLAAWGITLPFFMRSSWFKKRGYRRADKDGIVELVWKPFSADAVPPILIRRKKSPAAATGRVVVTCFRNGWCPARNLACERMKRAAAEYADLVDYVELDTDERSVLDEWGMSDAIFIDDEELAFGPPPEFEKVRKTLKKKVRRTEGTASL